MLLDNWYILLTAIVLAINSSLIGCFYVAGRNSLFSDAISHAVLPGIVLAYLAAKVRNTFFVMLGAFSSALLGTVLIQWLSKRKRIHYDGALGLVYSFFFALGVILISVYAQSIDLDQDCVLYGEIAFIGFDSVSIGFTEIPKALLYQVILMIILVAFVTGGGKMYRLLFFNVDYAKIHGISAKAPIFLFHTLSAALIVFNFDLVGAILVIAFMTTPAASGLLLATNFQQYIVISLSLSVLGVLLGFGIAYITQGSYSGSMAVGCFLIFICSLLVSRFRPDVTFHPSLLNK